ncbi:putative transposase, Ptta/En/Spm, plant [Helianthus anomalus]
MSEIVKGDKGRAKKKLVLVDEDDEIFQWDTEVDDVDQHEIQMADHDYSNDEDSILEQIQGPEKQKATSFNIKGNSIGRRKRLHITSTISTERVEDHVDDDQVEDQQVFETQGHQASEIQGAPKRVQGYTTKAEIWKMDSTKRIAVTFNKSRKPVGGEANELTQFLGTLARMADHVPIEYSDWRKVPIQKKEDMYSLVKSKFVIHPNETNEIKNWIFHSIGKKWREWKGSLKACAYDPSLTVDEIVAQQVKNDDRVNPTQFKELVTRWFTPDFQSTCGVKRMSRSKMKEPHVSGTNSFARLAHEMATENNGIHPTRGEMYIKTRTRKDGSIVDDNATQVVASLKKITNDSITSPDDPADFTNDDYSKVKGPEKRGYVRLVGRMPAAKSNATYSQTNDEIKSVIQTNDQLKSVVNAMAIIIQEHIPNANLSSVLSNINMQVPGTGSLVHNNSL